MQINSLLDKNAKEVPNKIYLFSKNTETSYEELHAKVNNIASSLLEMGIKKGDKIALYLRNTHHFIYAWFAINRIGAVMVPINTSFLVNETTYILNNSQAMGIIAEEDVLAPIIIPAVKHCLQINFVITTGEKEQNNIIPFSDLVQVPGSVNYNGEENELASLLYTSGTTGNPKGVMCAHRYYKYAGEVVRKALKVQKEDRLLTCLPLFHMNAQTLATSGSLASQSSIVLLERYSASTFWKDIKKYEATIFFYLGSILPILLKQPINESERNNKIRLAVGAQANPDKFSEYENRWSLKMIELYGMTEGIGAINPLDSRKIGSCGKAFPDHRLKIVDENYNELKNGEIGEIMLTGPSLSLGYFEDNEKTAETYRNGWVATGDLGYIDNEGYLFFVDRKKDIIRRSGENISSAEIERVLMNHPLIVEAAAIPIPDELRDEEIKVCIVPKEEAKDSLTHTEIIKWCESRLAKFKIPRYIVIRDSLPKTETQKIIKSKLIEESEYCVGWDRNLINR